MRLAGLGRLRRSGRQGRHASALQHGSALLDIRWSPGRAWSDSLLRFAYIFPPEANLTLNVGMKEVLEFKEGQSIIVNGAAGAVGNVLQTLLRLLVLMASIGCRPAG
jgi:hypothetical protein